VTDTLRPIQAVAAGGRGERAFPLLEGYRALAAAFVVATHAGFQTAASLRGPWAGTLARMDFGVALFFVLSGFLLFRPHAAAHLVGRAAPKTLPYVRRRALRILPAYWVVVVVAMVVFAENRQLGFRDWLVQLLLLQTYVPNGLITGLEQMWSLGTEVAFYAALPLLGLLVRHLPGRSVARRAAFQLAFLGVLAAIAIVYRLVVFTNTVHGRAAFWLPGYLDWFAVGMALATIYTLVSSGEPLPRWAAGIVDVAHSPGACFAAGAAVLWVSTSRIAGPYDLTPPTVTEALVKHVSYAVAAGLLLAPATIRPRPGGSFATIMGNPWMRALGTVSYGVFLWNMVVLQVFVRIIGQQVFTGSWLLDFTVTWVVSVAIAIVSWQVVERRFLRPRREAPLPAETDAAP
jgi:peptidoglycan/LPS O-acetylase OafA/YrhL